MTWPNDNSDMPVTVTDDDVANIPQAITYEHPDDPAGTSPTVVEVVGGPYLDVTRQTPFGIIDPTQHDGPFRNAWQWALDNQKEPDRLARKDPRQALGSQDILAGGNDGCFWPIIPSAGDGPADYWKCDDTIFFPAGSGCGTFGFRHGAMGANSNQKNVTRINWGDMDDRTKPAVVMQSERCHIRGLDLAAYSSNETWRGRLPVIIAYADCSNVNDTYYQASRNNLSSGGNYPRDFTVEAVTIGGANYGVHIGNYLSDTACDYFRATSMRFSDVAIGIMCTAAFSAQGMELVDIRGSWYDQYMIYFYSGCNAVIRNLNPGHNSSTGSPVAFVGTGTSNFRNSNLRIENTKLDANFGGQTFLSLPCSNLSVALNGGTDSPIANGGTGFDPDFIKLGGKNLLTIRDWQGVQGITHTPSSMGSVVAFESCRFWSDKIADPRSVVDETGGDLLHFSVRNCMGNEGVFMPDIPSAGPAGPAGADGAVGPTGPQGPAGGTVIINPSTGGASITMANTRIWSQPMSVGPFSISELLDMYGAEIGDVIDVRWTAKPSLGRAATTWSKGLVANPTNVTLNTDDEEVTLHLVTSDFTGKSYTNKPLFLSIGLVLAGDNLATYEPPPEYWQVYDRMLKFERQGVDNV